MGGNDHIAHDCPYCNLVYYSRGTLTTHVKNEHWHQYEEYRQLFIKPSLPTPLQKPIVLKGRKND